MKSDRLSLRELISIKHIAHETITNVGYVFDDKENSGKIWHYSALKLVIISKEKLEKNKTDILNSEIMSSHSMYKRCLKLDNFEMKLRKMLIRSLN